MKKGKTLYNAPSNSSPLLLGMTFGEWTCHAIEKSFPLLGYQHNSCTIANQREISNGRHVSPDYVSATEVVKACCVLYLRQQPPMWEKSWFARIKWGSQWGSSVAMANKHVVVDPNSMSVRKLILEFNGSVLGACRIQCRIWCRILHQSDQCNAMKGNWT